MDDVSIPATLSSKELGVPIQYAIHKHNAYLTEPLTLEDACRCMVLGSKFATSHNIIDKQTRTVIQATTSIKSQQDVKGFGLLVELEIENAGEDKSHRKFYIVTESRSHWFFVDYHAMMCKAKTVHI